MMWSTMTASERSHRRDLHQDAERDRRAREAVAQTPTRATRHLRPALERLDASIYEFRLQRRRRRRQHQAASWSLESHTVTHG